MAPVPVPGPEMVPAETESPLPPRRRRPCADKFKAALRGLKLGVPRSFQFLRPLLLRGPGHSGRLCLSAHALGVGPDSVGAEFHSNRPLASVLVEKRILSMPLRVVSTNALATGLPSSSTTSPRRIWPGPSLNLSASTLPVSCKVCTAGAHPSACTDSTNSPAPRALNSNVPDASVAFELSLSSFIRTWRTRASAIGLPFKSSTKPLIENSRR